MKLESLLNDSNVTVTQRVNYGEGYYGYFCHYRYSHRDSNIIIRFMAMAKLDIGTIQCMYLPNDKATLSFTPPCELVVRPAKRLKMTSKYEIKAWCKTNAEFIELIRILSQDTIKLIY